MRTKTKLRHGPLLCWDIYAMHLLEQAQNFNKQTEIEVLKMYQNKFDWSSDVEMILTKNDYEAIVLTDLSQDIQWVNKGFTKMTGYPANHAKGKKPSFLQGEASSEASLSTLRSNIKKGIQFKAQIINYRKNGEPYNCHIEIYPLKDADQNITHLLALENEIKIEST